jgi:hypothetical protein
MPHLLMIVNHSVIRKHNHAWVACTQAPIVKPSHYGEDLVAIEDFNQTSPDDARSFLRLEEAEAAFPRLVGKMIAKLESEAEELEAKKRECVSRLDTRIAVARAKILAATSIIGGGA